MNIAILTFVNDPKVPPCILGLCWGTILNCHPWGAFWTVTPGVSKWPQQSLSTDVCNHCRLLSHQFLGPSCVFGAETRVTGLCLWISGPMALARGPTPQLQVTRCHLCNTWAPLGTAVNSLLVRLVRKCLQPQHGPTWPLTGQVVMSPLREATRFWNQKRPGLSPSPSIPSYKLLGRLLKLSEPRFLDKLLLQYYIK